MARLLGREYPVVLAHYQWIEVYKAIKLAYKEEYSTEGQALLEDIKRKVQLSLVQALSRDRHKGMSDE